MNKHSRSLRLRVALVVTLLWVAAARANEPVRAMMYFSDGSSIELPFASRPVLRMLAEDGTVRLELDGDLRLEVPFESLRKVAFERTDDSGVTSVSLNGFADGETLEIYNLAGIKMRSFSIPQSGCLNFSSFGLPPGIYIFKTDSKVWKCRIN